MQQIRFSHLVEGDVFVYQNQFGKFEFKKLAQTRVDGKKANAVTLAGGRHYYFWSHEVVAVNKEVANDR